jgi:hypothetical protein
MRRTRREPCGEKSNSARRQIGHCFHFPESHDRIVDYPAQAGGVAEQPAAGHPDHREYKLQARSIQV